MVDSLAENIKGIVEGDERVLLLYLHGSRATLQASAVSDVDVAVVVMGGLDTILDLLYRLAKGLKVPEERIDIVDLAKAPLALKYEVLRNGVKVIDRGGYGEVLEKEVLERHPVVHENSALAVKLWLKEDPELNIWLVTKRLDELLKNATMIKERYLRLEPSSLLEDLEKTYAFERALHRAVEAMLDICRHVNSAKKLGLAESYSEYPLRIAEAKLMDKVLAEKVSELARLRNILIHYYADIDYLKLIAKAEELVNKVSPSFADWLRNFIRLEAEEK